MSPRITLAAVHASHVKDHGFVRSNIVQQILSMKAQNSAYQNAPGRQTWLDVRVLRAILELAKYYTFALSELAGGSHSKHSVHYLGAAFDVNIIDGEPVRLKHPKVRQFMDDCRALGAFKVWGPGDAGHETHVHAEWGRMP